MNNRTHLERFLEFVDKSDGSGCWIWTGSKFDKRGYGSFSIEGRTWRAHRAAWFLLYGKNPGKRLVLHRCDNPSCVRPDHLFLGSQADNVKDKVRKNRQAKGELAGPFKLTEQQVVEMRRLHATGEHSLIALGRRYNVTGATVGMIMRGETWQHVPDPQAKVNASMSYVRGDRHYTRKSPGMVRRGSSVASSKLTEAKVTEIRAALIAGENQDDLAGKFGVSRPTITRIKSRVIWNHVP